jgi:hypothetical protein
MIIGEATDKPISPVGATCLPLTVRHVAPLELQVFGESLGYKHDAPMVLNGKPRVAR